jgi:hypothetical protein
VPGLCGILNLWVPRSSVLEGRGLCRCYPDLDTGNQTKGPPLKSVTVGAPGRVARALRDFEFVGALSFGVGRAGLLSVLS